MTKSFPESPAGSIESIVEACKRRWVEGAHGFRKLLGKGMSRKRPREKTLRSAIYGNMDFAASEMRFVESFYLQRLRHVSQMGLLNLVYPDARHSRFEHSLGVAFSLRSLLNADPEVRNEVTKYAPTLSAAALLHDCGHGPFSHTTETLLEISGLDSELRPPARGEDGHVKPHERRCRDMILDRDFHLPNLGIEAYGIGETLDEMGIDRHAVVGLVTGQEPSPLLNLLSGNFDVDKMDYFRRDAFFTGTMGGGVDMEAIQRWVRIIPGKSYPEVAYDRRLVGHLLHLLYSREHVYTVTAFHPVARVAAALLLVAGDLALRGLPPDQAALVYSNIELLNDQELLSVLEIASSRGGSTYIQLLRRVVQRLYLRRLHKRLKTLSRQQFADAFAPCLKQLQWRGGLPPFAYCLLSEIANGKYVKLLPSRTTPRDDVVILEMTPPIGLASQTLRACEKERGILNDLQILDPDEVKPRSMAHWLDANAGRGAAEAHARALRAYKLSIWKALVLVPASVKFRLVNARQEQAFIRDFAQALGDGNKRRPYGLLHEWKAAAGIVGERVTQWRGQLA